MNVMLLGYLGLVLPISEKQSALVFCGYKLYDVDAPFSSGVTAIVNVTREEVECKNSEYNILNAKRISVNNDNQPCFIQRDFEWNKVNLPCYSVMSADCGMLLPSSNAVTLTTMHKGLVTALDTNAGVAVLNGQKAVELVTKLNATITNFAVYDGKPRVGAIYSKASFGEPITKNMQHFALIRCVEQFKLLTYFKNKVEQTPNIAMSPDIGNAVTQRMVEAANVGKALQKNEMVDPNRLREFTAITDNYIAVCNKNLKDLYSRIQGSQVSAPNSAEKSQNTPVQSQPVEKSKAEATVPITKSVETKPVVQAVEPAQPPKSVVQPEPEKVSPVGVQKNEAVPEAVVSNLQESTPTVDTGADVASDNVSVSESTSITAIPESKTKYTLNEPVAFEDIEEDDNREPVADLNGVEYEGQAVSSHAYVTGWVKSGGIVEREIERDKTPAASRLIGKKLGRDTIISIFNAKAPLFEYLLTKSDNYIPGSPAFWVRKEGDFFADSELEELKLAMELAKLVETKRVRCINGRTYEVLCELMKNNVEITGVLYPDESPFSIITAETQSPAGHTLSYNTLDFDADGVTMQNRNIQQIKQLVDNKSLIGATIESGKVKYTTHFNWRGRDGEIESKPLYPVGLDKYDIDTPLIVHKQSEKPTYSTYGRRDQFGNIKILRDDEIDDGYINSLTTLDLEYIYNWLNINVFATAAGGCAPNLRVFATDDSDSNTLSYECMYVFYKESEAQTKSVFDMSSANTGDVSKRLGGYNYVVRPVAVGVNLKNLCYAHQHSVCRGGEVYTSFYSAFILMMLYVSGHNIPTWAKELTPMARVVGKDLPDFTKACKNGMMSLYMNCMQRLQSMLGTRVPTSIVDLGTVTYTLGHKSAGYIHGDYMTGALSSYSIISASSKSECFYYPRLPENSIDKRLQRSEDLFRITECHDKRVRALFRTFAIYGSSKKDCTLKANEDCLGLWFKDHSIFNTRDFGVESLAPAAILQQRSIYVTHQEQRVHDIMWERFLDDGYRLTGADIADFVDLISTTKNIDQYQSLSDIPSDIKPNLCYDSQAVNINTYVISMYLHDAINDKQAGYGLWTAFIRAGGIAGAALIKACRQHRNYEVLNGIVPLIMTDEEVVKEFKSLSNYDDDDNLNGRLCAFIRRWLASFVLIRAIYNSNTATIPYELLNLYESIHISYNATPEELLAIPEIQQKLQKDAKFNLDFFLQSESVEYVKLFKLFLGIAILYYYGELDKVAYDRYNAYDAGLAAFFVRYKYVYDNYMRNYNPDNAVNDGFSTYYLFDRMQKIWICTGTKYGDFVGVWESEAVKEYNSQSVNLIISLCDLFERIRVMPIDMSNLSKTDFFLSFFGRIGYLTYALLTFSACDIRKLPQEYWALLNKPSLQGLAQLESKYHDILVTLD